MDVLLGRLLCDCCLDSREPELGCPKPSTLNPVPSQLEVNAASPELSRGLAVAVHLQSGRSQGEVEHA